MARARLLKPGFFLNDDLARLKPHARLLFMGLWLIADREGRLSGNVSKIKAQVFPYEQVPVASYLKLLSERGFITEYESENRPFIQIVNFKRHQTPHIKEPASLIPAPCEAPDCTDAETMRDPPLTLNHIPIPVAVAEREPPQPPLVRRRAEDPNLNAALTAYENLAGLAPEYVITEIREMLDAGTPVAWFDAAARESAIQNVRKWAYMRNILKRWQKDGFQVDQRKGALNAGRNGRTEIDPYANLKPVVRPAHLAELDTGMAAAGDETVDAVPPKASAAELENLEGNDTESDLVRGAGGGR